MFITNFSHCGWRLETNTDQSNLDVRKYEHRAVHDDGRNVLLDFSPYEIPALDVFEMLVNTGFPNRRDLGLAGPIRNDTARGFMLNRSTGSVADYDDLAAAVEAFDAKLLGDGGFADLATRIGVAAQKCGWDGTGDAVAWARRRVELYRVIASGNS